MYGYADRGRNYEFGASDRSDKNAEQEYNNKFNSSTGRN